VPAEVAAKHKIFASRVIDQRPTADVVIFGPRPGRAPAAGRQTRKSTAYDLHVTELAHAQAVPAASCKAGAAFVDEVRSPRPARSCKAARGAEPPGHSASGVQMVGRWAPRRERRHGRQVAPHNAERHEDQAPLEGGPESGPQNGPENGLRNGLKNGHGNTALNLNPESVRKSRPMKRTRWVPLGAPPGIVA
jgi:hypothetical protein